MLAQKLGRALTAAEGAFLGTLSNIYHNFRLSGRVTPYDLQRLGFRTREANRPHFERAYERWWTMPPASPLELWNYLAFDIESSGLAIPEFMRPITETAAVPERIRARQRQETIARWQERLKGMARQASGKLQKSAGDARENARKGRY